MKFVMSGLLACGLMMGWATIASAAQPGPNDKVMVPKTFRLSALHGIEIRNLQGEKLGTVDDFVMNIDNGKVNYVALATGGVLGVGEKLFAIPYNELQLKFDGSTKFFVANIAKEKLQNSKGFDKDHWPETAPQGFAGPIEHNAAAPKVTPR